MEGEKIGFFIPLKYATVNIYLNMKVMFIKIFNSKFPKLWIAIEFSVSRDNFLKFNQCENKSVVRSDSIIKHLPLTIYISHLKRTI